MNQTVKKNPAFAGPPSSYRCGFKKYRYRAFPVTPKIQYQTLVNYRSHMIWIAVLNVFFFLPVVSHQYQVRVVPRHRAFSWLKRSVKNLEKELCSRRLCFEHEPGKFGIGGLSGYRQYCGYSRTYHRHGFSRLKSRCFWHYGLLATTASASACDNVTRS